MLGKNFKLGWGIYIYTPDNVSLWKFTRKWKSKLKTGRPSPPPPLGSATRTWAQDDGRAFGYVLAESRPQETVVGVEDLGQLDVEDLGQLYAEDLGQLGVFLLAQREKKAGPHMICLPGVGVGGGLVWGLLAPLVSQRQDSMVTSLLISFSRPSQNNPPSLVSATLVNT